MIDPRFAPIIAAASAAAAVLSPGASKGAAVLSTLIQAMSDFHEGYTAGTITDEDLAEEVGEVQENLAGLHADAAAQKGGV